MIGRLFEISERLAFFRLLLISLGRHPVRGHPNPTTSLPTHAEGHLISGSTPPAYW